MFTQTLPSHSFLHPFCCCCCSLNPSLHLLPPSSTRNSYPLSLHQWRFGRPLFASDAPFKTGSGFTIYRNCATRSGFSVCKAPSIEEDRFDEEVLKSDVPVLVDFCADWCGPCKLVAPLMDWVAEEYKGILKVYKIDTDANPTLVERYKVYGLPTLLLFKDGIEVAGSRREGAINKKKLKILLDGLLASVPTM